MKVKENNEIREKERKDERKNGINYKTRSPTKKKKDVEESKKKRK